MTNWTKSVSQCATCTCNGANIIRKNLAKTTSSFSCFGVSDNTLLITVMSWVKWVNVCTCIRIKMCSNKDVITLYMLIYTKHILLSFLKRLHGSEYFCFWSLTDLFPFFISLSPKGEGHEGTYIADTKNLG